MLGFQCSAGGWNGGMSGRIHPLEFIGWAGESKVDFPKQTAQVALQGGNCLSNCQRLLLALRVAIRRFRRHSAAHGNFSNCDHGRQAAFRATGRGWIDGREIWRCGDDGFRTGVRRIRSDCRPR